MFLIIVSRNVGILRHILRGRANVGAVWVWKMRVSVLQPRREAPTDAQIGSLRAYGQVLRRSATHPKRADRKGAPLPNRTRAGISGDPSLVFCEIVSVDTFQYVGTNNFYANIVLTQSAAAYPRSPTT